MTQFRQFIRILLIAAVVCMGSAQEKNQPEISPELLQLGLVGLLDIEVRTVYAASRYEQKVTEAPSSVSIVTADEIRKYGYRNLGEILRSLRGFSFGTDRNYSYLGVRGFGRSGDYNSRMLLLVNGHRNNENVYDAASIGSEFVLDIDLIDHLEVIRGPSSSLYGNNAFFGVINVVTKDGADLKGAEVSGDFGSFDTYKGRVTYGNKFENGVTLIFSGSYFDSEGDKSLYYEEYDFPETNNGIAWRRDYDRSKNFFAQGSYKDFTLTGAYASREKGIPTGSFETVFNDPENQTVDEHSYLDLKHEYLSADDLRIISRLFYDRYRYSGLYNYDVSEEGDLSDLVLNDDRVWGDWWGLEVQGTKTLFDRHVLTLGMEFRDNLRQDQANFDIEPRYVYLDDQRSSQIWSPFVQGDIQVLTNLTMSAGARYDHYDSFGGTANPRLGLIYNPHPKTILKALYGTAFRAPNVFELYYGDDGETAKGNPQLVPETIDTYELVWEQYIGSKFRTSLSGYFYEIDDLISETTDPEDELSFFDNIDRVEARGIELELEGNYAQGLRSRISYSVQQTEDAQTKEFFPNSPKHLIKLNLIAPVYQENIFASFELQYASTRKTLRRNDSGDYWLANATLFSRELVKSMELSTGVYNLFDDRYGDPGGSEHFQDVIRQNGRTFRVKLTYRF